jgi:hypothetical protein
MCTVTILPGAALLSTPPLPRPFLRLVFSRDELRSRRPAHPPEERVVEGRRILMPIDGDAGGTWIAVNDAGLVFGLLNLTATAPRRATCGASSRDVDTSTPECTRGAIIPLLAGCPRLADVVRCLGGDRGDGGSSRTGRPAFLDRYRPFRVVAASRDAMVEAVWDRNSLRVRQQPLEGPRLRTSSSLGDALVTRPRAALFRQWFRSRPVDPRVQDAFHRHQWPGRTRVSVLMAREDACTASVTTIELHAERATMEYVALDGGMSGRATLSLTEQEAGFRSKARPGCHR